MNIETILKHYNYNNVEFNIDKVYVTIDKTQPHTCDGYHVLVPECSDHEHLTASINKTVTKDHLHRFKTVDVGRLKPKWFTIRQMDENYNVFNWKNSLNVIHGSTILDGDYVNFRGNPFPLRTLLAVNDLLITYLKCARIHVTPFHKEQGITTAVEDLFGVTVELVPFNEINTLQFDGKDSIVAWVEDLAELLICDEYTSGAVQEDFYYKFFDKGDIHILPPVQRTIDELINNYDAQITLTKGCKYVVLLDEREYFVPTDEELVKFLDNYKQLSRYIG